MQGSPQGKWGKAGVLTRQLPCCCTPAVSSLIVLSTDFFPSPQHRASLSVNIPLVRLSSLQAGSCLMLSAQHAQGLGVRLRTE